MAELYKACQNVIMVDLERRCVAVSDIRIDCNDQLSPARHEVELCTAEEVRDPEIAKAQLVAMVRGLCSKHKSYLGEKSISCESGGEIRLVKRTQSNKVK